MMCIHQFLSHGSMVCTAYPNQNHSGRIRDTSAGSREGEVPQNVRGDVQFPSLVLSCHLGIASQQVLVCFIGCVYLTLDVVINGIAK
jgi:hypothetical protein